MKVLLSFAKFAYGKSKSIASEGLLARIDKAVSSPTAAPSLVCRLVYVSTIDMEWTQQLGEAEPRLTGLADDPGERPEGDVSRTATRSCVTTSAALAAAFPLKRCTPGKC
jgi:hypothetical protein